ncbi:MAG: hypothetical protein RI958_2900 [Actinomycetota bacterium]
MSSRIARAVGVGSAVALLQQVLHGGGLGSPVEVLRTAVPVTVAAALVFAVVELIWPSIRRGLGLDGRLDGVARALSITLGVSVAMTVLSWLHGLLSDTSHAHEGLMTSSHHQMGAFEHAVRDGGAVAPVVLAVLAVGAMSTSLFVRLRQQRLTETARGAGRWSALAGVVGGTIAFAAPVTLPTGVANAIDAPAPACDASTAARSYDVAAVNVFIPYSRWITDAIDPITLQPVPVVGPDGTPHLTDGDPNGMVFVLQQDKLATLNWHRELIGDPNRGYPGDPAAGRRLRPRPLVLRANEGECIEITLTNELLRTAMGPFLPQVDPRVSMHAFGVSYAPNSGDGSQVGYNADTTVGIGESTTYYWRAPKSEGLYLFRDMGMPVGGASDGGGSEHGLYGGLAVQPAGSRWFDPVSGAELSSSVPDQQYAGVANQNGELYIDAVIAMPTGERYREAIQISQDVIPVGAVAPAPGAVVPPEPLVLPPERFSFNYGSEAEYKRYDYKDQWCANCVGEETSLSSWVYGDPASVKLASGPGPWLPGDEMPNWGPVDPLATPGGVPAGNVESCGLKLTNLPGETKTISCYTANVIRAYQGDPIKIRFGHAGIIETHVFHLHAHTWAAEPDDEGPAGEFPPKPTATVQPRATTIDSQTYSPWTAFTANLNWGAGAHVGTAGDSIFHCHLYPHFAAGFWALLRVHDKYENGLGATPDGKRVNEWKALREIGAEIPVHASVPQVKPAPSLGSPGYPRFIPGEYGWRAPQPINGVWQREFDPVTGAVVTNPVTGNPVETLAMRNVAGRALDPALLTNLTQTITVDRNGLNGRRFTLNFAGQSTAPISADATALEMKAALEALDAIEGVNVDGTNPWRVRLVLWKPVADLRIMPPSGGISGLVTVIQDLGFATTPEEIRMVYKLAIEQNATHLSHEPTYKPGDNLAQLVNKPLPGAPMVDPCPDGVREVTYRASVIQLPITYNEAGWIDVQGRVMVADQDVDAILSGAKEPEPFFFRVNQGDCINFELTNRTPNHIGNDAFLQLVQTNMVGAHIHLVNFDVLASDGASNGWNYQQAAFTQDQAAFDSAVINGVVDPLNPLDPPVLTPCNLLDGCLPALPEEYDPVTESQDPIANWRKNGQTIKERWFADYELRTVFMHDHHFAAVMQNRGMFNALIVEPLGFDFRDPKTGQFLQPINNANNGGAEGVCGAVCVGSAYGSQMDVIGPRVGDDFREYGVAVHDFISLIVPPGLPADLTLADIQNPANAVVPPPLPDVAPIHDQGGMAINYKNAPMTLRQYAPGAEPGVDPPVDPAYVFSSRVWGDPMTPLLRAYRGDNIRFRLIQGSHEEQHNFTVHGIRWKKDAQDPASPYVNTRPIGVSEAFNIDSVADCGLADTVTCPAGRPGEPAVTDLLYGGTGMEDLWMGAWGILRVFDQTIASAPADSTLGVLPTLPDNDLALVDGDDLPEPDPGLEVPRAQTGPSCPEGAPTKVFNVSVIDANITYNRYGDHDPYGLAYVLTADVPAIRAGTKEVEPLVMRVSEGDCVIVNLTNSVDWDLWNVHGARGTFDGDAPAPGEAIPIDPLAPPEAGGVVFNQWIAGNRVSMHPSLLRYDVRSSDGATVGYNFDQTAGPGETYSYTWFADEIVYDDPQNPIGLTDGELGVVPLTPMGDVRGHRHHGLLAGLVVGPANATYHDPYTGEIVRTGAVVDVRIPNDDDYRDAVLFHHNGLNLRRAGVPPVDPDVPDPRIIQDALPADWPDLGERAISYKNAPLYRRLQLPNPIVTPLAFPLGQPFTAADFGRRLASVFSSTAIINGRPIGDPDTPIIRAYAGDQVRLHVVQASDRGRMIETEISGHNWLEHAFDAGSVRAGVQGSSATGTAFTFHIGVAGGDMRSVGDYRYGVIHGFQGLSSGSWGIFRVYPRPEPGTEHVLSPLSPAEDESLGQNPYLGGNPIHSLEPAGLTTAPVITLTSPTDFATLPSAGLTVPVTAKVTVDGKPLARQLVRISLNRGTAPAAAATGLDGTVTFNVPMTFPNPRKPATPVVITATSKPVNADQIASVMSIEIIDSGEDVTKPTVTSVTPADSTTLTDPDGNITVNFSERIHPNTVTTDSIKLTKVSGGAVVPAAVTLSADRKSVTIDPSSTLGVAIDYRVNVGSAVTDLAGNAIVAWSSTFRTPPVPSATGKPVPTWGDTRVNLAWSAPAPGAVPVTDYVVQHSTDGTNWSTFADGTSTATTASVTGLTNGLTHWFRVAAVNIMGQGTWSAVSDASIPRGLTTQGLVSMMPVRLFDTRPNTPEPGVLPQTGLVGGARVVKIKIAGAAGVPNAGVAAVALNVTVTEATGPGFLTVYPCGTIPLASNLNYEKGQTVPNSVIAPISDNGEVCFYSNVNTHVVADVSGWFKKGISFNSVAPVRLFDTRPGEDQGVVGVSKEVYGPSLTRGENLILRVKVTDVAGVPSADQVGAVALNITATQTEGSGFVTVYPCGDRPGTSNLNFVAKQTVPNLVIAPVSADGRICIYSSARTHLIADVSGWFQKGVGHGAVGPARLFDTRPDGDGGLAAVQKIPVGGDYILKVKVTGRPGVPESGVGAVALNVTSTESTLPGFVTVFPCGTVPTASNVNFAAGQTVPNSVVAPVSASGEVCFYSNVRTHLVADVSGWFAA